MRILLSGYYGFGNVGDEALLAGLLSRLLDLGHEPIVLSAHPRATRRLHGVASVHRVSGALPALLRADALVSGGGGLLQDHSSRRSLSYYLSLIRMAQRLSKPVAVYGQSVGPLSQRGRKAVKRTLRGVPVAVRDSASRELLSSLAIESRLVADPALLLDPPRLPNRSPQQDRPVVLIPRSGYPDLGEALVLLGRHERAHGVPVVVLALHPGEDDGEALRLASAVPGATLKLATDHQEALTVIAGAQLVASARLHGLILATVCDTPWLGLVYDPKVSGFAREAGGVALDRPVDGERLVDLARGRSELPSGSRLELLKRAGDGVDWLDRVLVERIHGGRSSE